MKTKHTRLTQFQQKICKFPNLKKYLSPSLSRRLQGNDWFENRVIRYILNDSTWVRDLEITFQTAQLDSVANSQQIFSVLQGAAPDYDERLFDALSEVRLAAWARSNGYQEIEKLQETGVRQTPDFQMVNWGHVALAEAKHLRVRDYLVDLVADRLEGLWLKSGRLDGFGLSVENSYKYVECRVDALDKRDRWINKARNELTEEWFKSAIQRLEKNPTLQLEILDGLFVLERNTYSGPMKVLPGVMYVSGSKRPVEWCLRSLRRRVLSGLKQIKDFMETTGANATHAVVFVSGVDEWQPEWDQLWKTLDTREQWAWDCVTKMKEDADKLIGMPFKLIVGRYKKIGKDHYGSIEYRPFAWLPSRS